MRKFPAIRYLLQNEDCATALMVACQNGHVKVVKTLISNDADVNCLSKGGEWSPVLVASYCNQVDVLELLIQHGAQLDIRDEEGFTPLMLATEEGHASVVKTLLDGRANPNITDKTSGWTAIFFAVEEGNLEIIELLIKGGAKLNIKDNNGLTVFEVAKAHEQRDVCDLLERYGSKTTENITQEQREQVKASSQRLKRVFAFIERTLLREKAKKEQQRPADSDKGGGTPSNFFQRRREKQLARKMKGVTIDTDTTTELAQ